MEAPDLLASGDLAVDVALFDQEGVLANVLHLEPEQLLRRTQPLVSNERHHRCGIEPVPGNQRGPDFSTCAGARQTTARSRLAEGFLTALTGFICTQPQRIACSYIACSTTIDWRTE
jgi:hypothetical protein